MSRTSNFHRDHKSSALRTGHIAFPSGNYAPKRIVRDHFTQIFLFLKADATAILWQTRCLRGMVFCAAAEAIRAGICDVPASSARESTEALLPLQT
ncbi:MAG: hypothetical protein M3N22_05510 [Acidobacteriota bacterium]|nr:hypothetical protein [Acidobacteriota bacterium]